MSDWEFIFDGVFGFLTSPLWEVPIMSFIETQSIVFEPSEENQGSWAEIHKKYKSLIESLLSSYLKDVGITEEQFMKACGSPGARNAPKMQPVYEQLWAADDYEIFKRMMIQRNVELQLEALELIKKRQGAAKNQSNFQSAPVSKSEEEILAEVMRKSEEEYKESQKKATQENVYDPAMEAILATSNESERLEEEVRKTQEETKKTVINGLEAPPEPVSPASVSNTSQTYSPQPIYKPKEEKSAGSLQTEKEKKKENDLKALRNAPPMKPTAANAPPLKSPAAKTQTETSGDAASSWIASARADARKTETVTAPRNEPSTDDMSKRAEYLKQQRDRLLLLKKDEREKKLSDYTKSQPKRPTSARVAKQAISGGTENPAPLAEDQKRIAMRKALAEKLKREVVYK